MRATDGFRSGNCASQSRRLRNANIRSAQAAGQWGSAPVAAVRQEIARDLGAETTLVKVSAETIDKQIDHHPELKPSDYERLVGLLENGLISRQSATHLAFVEQVEGDDLPWVAIIKRTLEGKEQFLVSFYQPNSRRYVRRLLQRGGIGN